MFHEYYYIHSSEVTVTTTTTTIVTTTAAPSAPSNAEKLLNSAPLNPMKTNDANVDQMVANILSQITNIRMTTYQKVVAIYSYIIQTFTYGGSSDIYFSDVNYNMMLDSIIVSQAYTLLKTNIGVCDHYASLFLVMTRAIGLGTYLVSGQVAKKSGGTTGHTWTNIKLNGEYYVFDPQVEQNNLINGQIQYKYFCRTDASAANVYAYEISPIMEICVMYYNGETVTVNNARDFAIQLFGSFELGSGDPPYVFVS